MKDRLKDQPNFLGTLINHKRSDCSFRRCADLKRHWLAITNWLKLGKLGFRNWPTYIKQSIIQKDLLFGLYKRAEFRPWPKSQLNYPLTLRKMHTEPSQTSKIKLFEKVINAWKPRCINRFWVHIYLKFSSYLK